MAKSKSKSKGKSKPAINPGHFTEKGTRKFQANGEVAWGRVFQAAAGKDVPMGVGIRAAMQYAIDNEKDFLRWVQAAAVKSKVAAEKGAK